MSKSMLVILLTMVCIFGIGGLRTAAGQDITSRLHAAQILSTVEPVYPPNVVNPGTVILEISVGTSGAVEQVRVVRPAPGFTDEAVRTVKQWKFSAATLDGRPIRSLVPAAISFSQPLVWRPS
jgi:TonB family protein